MTSPAYSGVLNNAAGDIIQKRLISMGKAANDPVIGRTLTAVSSGARAFIGLRGGSISKFGWAKLIGAGAAISAGALIYAKASSPLTIVENGITFKFNNDGTVDVSGFGATANDFTTYPVCQAGSDLFAAVGKSYDGYCVNSARTTFSRLVTKTVSCSLSQPLPICSGKSLLQYVNTTFSGPALTPLGNNFYFRVTNSYSVSSDSDKSVWDVIYSYTVPSGVTLTPPAPSSAGISVDSAQALVPAPLSNSSLSDQQLANAVNAALAAANSVNPLEVPELVSNPITASEANAYRVNHPSALPTVSDYFSPVAAPGVNDIPLPNPQTGDSATVTPGTQVIEVKTNVDFGTFNGPDVPEPPTADQILNPLFNFFPDWKNFSMPSHSSICPTPSFIAFGHEYQFTQLCQWVELIRVPLGLIMIVCFSLASFFIVLSA